MKSTSGDLHWRSQQSESRQLQGSDPNISKVVPKPITDTSSHNVWILFMSYRPESLLKRNEKQQQTENNGKEHELGHNYPSTPEQRSVSTSPHVLLRGYT
jgi:hypothetical protein